MWKFQLLLMIVTVTNSFANDYYVAIDGHDTNIGSSAGPWKSFAHAMTIHKSQGSTYDTVYLDTEDLGMVANMDYIMYLRLLYVAVSRASNKVITN